MAEAAVKLVNISKSFGQVKANSNVSLEINKGEILALLGEN
jgi:simple sugar transport system ATP-binding protein